MKQFMISHILAKNLSWVCDIQKYQMYQVEIIKYCKSFMEKTKYIISNKTTYCI